MPPNPYLAHLIPDPTYGYLFSHRLALSAFGLPNVYQLNKHRPNLTEGQHWIKILGNDHIERLYYTHSGLLRLCDLIHTPQAQQFKQALSQHPLPGGAIVPAPTTAIVHPFNFSADPDAEPVDRPDPREVDRFLPPDFGADRGSTLAPSLPHPAAQVAQQLSPYLEAAIDRSLSARMPTPPQNTADLLFQQQQLDLQKQQAWTESLLKAQQQVANLRPHQTTVSTTTLTHPVKRISTWLDQQDIWAFTLAAACLICMIGVGSYLLVASTVKSQAPTYPTQTWR